MKKFLFLLLFIMCTFSVSISAEEYVFTVSEDFPMPYSTSIKVVNADHGLFTSENLEDIQPLIDQGIVTYCEPVSYSELFDYVPNDYYYSKQSNLSLVSTQFAWNKGAFGETPDGEKVKIAVIDSGVSGKASDFTFLNIHKATDYTQTAQTTPCEDEIGHGTRVTGIIAAAHNTRGIAGIAPKAEIYVFKCFYVDEYGNQKGNNTNIAAAMYEAIDTYDVDIINLSSGTTNPLVFKEVCDYAEEKGVLIISAVGNYGHYSNVDTATALYFPASYDNVIGVGSVDANGKKAAHSQLNDYVDIMAPGMDVYSVSLESYEKGSGTSFATPHVVGAAALAKSLFPNATIQEITDALYHSADEMTEDYTGHGSLNIQGLLTCLYASQNPGALVKSLFNETLSVYCVPPKGFSSYFSRINKGIMIDVKSFGMNTKERTAQEYDLYIWKKNSLEPYSGNINELSY